MPKEDRLRTVTTEREKRYVNQAIDRCEPDILIRLLEREATQFVRDVLACIYGDRDTGANAPAPVELHEALQQAAKVHSSGAAFGELVTEAAGAVARAVAVLGLPTFAVAKSNLLFPRAFAVREAMKSADVVKAFNSKARALLSALEGKVDTYHAVMEGRLAPRDCPDLKE